jgi:ABC-type nitrate/sulfonate/bicarbonate transport system ATPase subunit
MAFGLLTSCAEQNLLQRRRLHGIRRFVALPAASGRLSACVGRSYALVALEIRDVHKTFSGRGGGVHALNGVNLHASSNEFVSVVGPSGCGKSTLFNLIAGLDLPDSGEISIHDRVVNGATGLVGYMPQKDLLFPWLSVLDNATLGLEIQGISQSEARGQARELMGRFGLAGFEQRYPADLSGGMRQRAAFLRTVLCRRDVMLLDEPFGALDALTRQSMQEWLLSLWDELRPTILFVTHDIDEALFLSDRVYVMSTRPGRMVLELPVSLPRPRDYHLLTEPHLVELKAHLLKALRSASAEEAAA